MKKIIIIIGVFITLMTSKSFAQPANDDCSGAIDITSSINSSSCYNINIPTTATASVADCGTSCTGGGSANIVNDIWYKFTPASSGTYTWSASATSGQLYDAKLQVFSGTCASLTSLTCSYLGDVSASLTGGTTYYIRADGMCSQTGGYCLKVSSGCSSGATINDVCTSAVSMGTASATPLSKCGTLVGCAITGETNPSCWTASNTAWYSFTTATWGGAYTVNMTESSSGTPNLAIYSGSCASLTQVTCATSSPMTTASLTASTTYFLKVDLSSTYVASYCLGVIAPPQNDLICSATTITPNTNCVDGNNTGGSNTGAPANPTCWTTTPSNDVWFKFTADDDSMIVSTDYYGDGSGDLDNTEIAIYSSSDNTCTGTLAQVGCNEDGSPYNVLYKSTASMTGLVPGKTYFVRIDGYSTNVGDFCVTAYDWPDPNETWGQTPATAQAATVHSDCNCESNMGGNCWDYNGNQPTNNTNQYTTTVGTNYCGCDDETGQEGVWTTFVANSTSTTLTNFSGASRDFTVFKDSCGLTCVQCNTTADASNFSFTTVVGATYTILTTNTSGTTGDIYSQFCLTSGSACTPPANNACGSAQAISANTTYFGTNACATADLSLCSGSTETNVWYSWTVPASWPAGQTAILKMWDQNCIDEANASSGTQVSVYEPNLDCSQINATTCIVRWDCNCSSDFFAGWDPIPGATYLINFDGEAGLTCDFKFSIGDGVNPSCETFPPYITGSTSKVDTAAGSGTTYTIEMNEPVNCCTIKNCSGCSGNNCANCDFALDQNGSSSSISGNEIISVTPLNCVNDYTTSIQVTLAAVPDAPYDSKWRIVANGTQGNITLKDACNNVMVAGIVEGAVILPIELLSFTGKYENGYVQLNWSTASEKNNSYYIIERSADAVNFVEIGKIPGAGNSTTDKHYAMTDSKPLGGINYYRLIAVDYSGIKHNVSIIAVSVKNEVFAIKNIKPIPATDKIVLLVTSDTDTEESEFQIYDLSGRQVYKENRPLKAGENEIGIDISFLSNGAYFAAIKKKGELVYSKLIKY